MTLSIYITKIFCNIIVGKVVRPEKSSEKFMSMIGSLDYRVDLDKTIKIGDIRYNRHVAVMAAKLSYENEKLNRTVIQQNWQVNY